MTQQPHLSPKLIERPVETTYILTAALGLDDNRELEAAIKAYIDATNAGPKPFRWSIVQLC